MVLHLYLPLQQSGPEVDTVNAPIPVGSMPPPGSFKPMPHFPLPEYNQASLKDQPSAHPQPPVTFPPPPPTTMTSVNSSVVTVEQSSGVVATSAVSITSDTTPNTVNSDIAPITTATASDASVSTGTVIPVETIVTDTTASSNKPHKDKGIIIKSLDTDI